MWSKWRVSLLSEIVRFHFLDFVFLPACDINFECPLAWIRRLQVG